MRYFIPALLIVLAIGVETADAKPPRIEGFVRLAQLRQQLAQKLAVLRKAEDFAGKPLPEQMLIKWDEGATKFGTKKLNSKEVLGQIFKWNELTAAEPSEAALRVIALLPEVMARKYGQVRRLNRSFKNDRYKATKDLVAQLVKPPLHVRKLAIASLNAVYSTRRQYVATDGKSARAKRQGAWETYIKKIKK